MTIIDRLAESIVVPVVVLEKVEDVNYCGVILLLRKLVASGHCTKKAAGRIAARIAKQTGADIILSI